MNSGEIVRILVAASALLAAISLALQSVGRRKASPPARVSITRIPQPTIQIPARTQTPASPIVGSSVATASEVREPQLAAPTAATVHTAPVRLVPNAPAMPLVSPLPLGPVVRRAPLVLRPIDRPYWDLQHWRRQGDRLVGFYRTPQGSYEGYILHPDLPRPEFHIVRPPKELKQHRHSICFRPIGSVTYSIHFSPAPPNADAGILEVEKVLGEALTGRGRRNA